MTPQLRMAKTGLTRRNRQELEARIAQAEADIQRQREALAAALARLRET